MSSKSPNLRAWARSQLKVETDYRAKLRATLFPQQAALLDDHAHPKRAACCSRRAGKTQAVIRGLLEKCLDRPKSVAVYFATTLASARKLVWDTPDGLPGLISDLGLSAICEVNETDHRVTFDNGSVLWVSGAETLADARRWKGLRYDLAVIDEAQDWPEEILDYMINQALSPALMDRRGEMLVTGTPGPYLGGLFYEIATGIRPGWGRHGWTCLENPHIPDAGAYIAAEVASRGLSMDDPVVMREFRGLWVRDSTTLLFQYQPGRNDYAALPQATAWRYVLGMDLGLRDLTTYVVMGFRPYDPTVYVIEVHGERATDKTAPVSRMSDVVRGYQRKYGQGLRMVMDAGALGLGWKLELQNRLGLTIDAAKKTDKPGAIRLLNDQLRLGLVKAAPSCGALTEQWLKIQIDPRTQIEKPAQPCDYADAALYAWRECYAYLAAPAPDDSAEGMQRAMVQRVLQQRRDQGDKGLAQERREMAFTPFDG